MKSMITLSQQQKLTMSPKMQQALEILQMDTLSLNSYIQQVALENPLIELQYGDVSENATDDKLKKLEWLERMNSDGSISASSYALEEVNLPFVDQNQSDSLHETLLFQLSALRLPKELEKSVRFLIENLDENGYLTPNDSLVEKRMRLSGGRFQWALNLVQQMDPAGVGARNLQECLLLQVKRMEEPCPMLEKIISDHLELLAKNQLSKLAKILNVSLEQIKEARGILLSLNPKPGNGFFSHGLTPYIVPDIFIECVGEKFEIIFNDYNQPRIIINSYYRNLIGSENKEITQYIINKLRQSEWLIHCTQQREKTILLCIEVILEKQSDFFRSGPGNLHPMILADVADQLQMHSSTVSRAISGKYLQCKWGNFALSSFFSRSVGDASKEVVMERLEKVICSEDTQKPFSDQEISEILERDGIAISRRTVAKYREMLNIQPSGRRKAY